MKTNVAVFYGCRSVEHEVSIISAVQAMRSIDCNKYNVAPVYVLKTEKCIQVIRFFPSKSTAIYRNY